jgi:FMN phosphatase YigB (HAD superfamily)
MTTFLGAGCAALARVAAPDASEPTPPPRLISAAVDKRAGKSPFDARRPWGMIFEPANVLYDATLWWRWFRGLLGQFLPEDRSVQAAWLENYLPQVRRGRREFGEALEAFLQSTGLQRAEIDELLAAGLARRRDLEFEVLPVPGVKWALSRLRDAGLRLAILSDSAVPGADLVSRIERLGLGGLFQAVLSSVELGEVKPALVCYRAALETLGLPAEQVWFVGNSASDLLGAARAGLRTIGFQAAPELVVDARLSHFDELVDVAVSAVGSV